MQCNALLSTIDSWPLCSLNAGSVSNVTTDGSKVSYGLRSALNAAQGDGMELDKKLIGDGMHDIRLNLNRVMVDIEDNKPVPAYRLLMVALEDLRTVEKALRDGQVIP